MTPYAFLVDWDAVVAYWREAVVDMEKAGQGKNPVYK
jgi:hypothetical protein